ncbi:MAG TPA: hypothetical protein VMK66_03430 [Myxococcales bacterium]|nr:hypothetical protein [Myxococcales bacterium]
MRIAAALVAVLCAAAARADTVTNEAFANSARSADANPRPGMFTDALNASFDFGPNWTLNLGGSLTLQGETPAATRAGYPDSGSAVTLLTAGVDWSATDSLMIGLRLEGSPTSTQYAGTTIGLRNPAGNDRAVDAELRSQTWEAGFGLDAWWDTLGHSDLEWSANGAVAFSHFNVNQTISDVRSTLTDAQVRNQAALYCAAHPGSLGCAKGLQGAVDLDFARLSGGAVATLYQDTEVSLFADYYLYGEDPAAIGYYGVASEGRGPNVPIAPLRYLIRPEVMHRFGSLTVKLWLQGGEFVAGTGYDTEGIGAKVQYRFSRSFRLWASASGQRDVDATRDIIRSVTVSLGAGYRW